MYTDEEYNVNPDPMPTLSSIIWRSLLFISMLLLLFYIGMQLPL
jgi:hypothetical protein